MHRHGTGLQALSCIEAKKKEEEARLGEGGYFRITVLAWLLELAAATAVILGGVFLWTLPSSTPVIGRPPIIVGAIVVAVGLVIAMLSSGSRLGLEVQSPVRRKRNKPIDAPILESPEQDEEEELEIDDDADEAAREQKAKKRIDNLRKQIYGVAASLYKYADPDEGGSTRWDHVEPLNELLYKLIAEGEDVGAFVVPFGWRDDTLVDAYVKDHLLVTRLEGLLVYLRSVGLPSSD